MIFSGVKAISIPEGLVKQIACAGKVLWQNTARLAFGSYTGDYTTGYVTIDGNIYRIYELRTSGILTIKGEEGSVPFFASGAGSGGNAAAHVGTTTSSSNGTKFAGRGGSGGHILTGEITPGEWIVTIGAGGIGGTPSTQTTSFTTLNGANGGDTSLVSGDITHTAAGGTSSGGGSGAGAGGVVNASSNYEKYYKATSGDGESTIPFDIADFKAHAPGGGGGGVRYAPSPSDSKNRKGGKGGSNGANGGSQSSADLNAVKAGVGGEYGGGNGGEPANDATTVNGHDATAYGAGAGGGALYFYETGSPILGEGGTGYQGVVYVAIPSASAPEGIVITKQPEGGAIAIGDSWTFSVEATGVEKYRWQVSMDGGTNWTNLTWTGSQTATMTRTGMNAGTISYHYRCMLTGTDGSIVYTNVVTFTQI